MKACGSHTLTKLFGRVLSYPCHRESGILWAGEDTEFWGQNDLFQASLFQHVPAEILEYVSPHSGPQGLAKCPEQVTLVKQGTEDPVGKNLDKSPEAQPLARIKHSTKEAIITAVLLYRDPPTKVPLIPWPLTW